MSVARDFEERFRLERQDRLVQMPVVPDQDLEGVGSRRGHPQSPDDIGRAIGRGDESTFVQEEARDIEVMFGDPVTDPVHLETAVQRIGRAGKVEQEFLIVVESSPQVLDVPFGRIGPEQAVDEVEGNLGFRDGDHEVGVGGIGTTGMFLDKTTGRVGRLMVMAGHKVRINEVKSRFSGIALERVVGFEAAEIAFCCLEISRLQCVTAMFVKREGGGTGRGVWRARTTRQDQGGKGREGGNAKTSVTHGR